MRFYPIEEEKLHYHSEVRGQLGGRQQLLLGPAEPHSFSSSATFTDLSRSGRSET